jgi:hypothetical protein
MRGGSRGVRASINGEQFVECGRMRGGSRAPDAKIKAGVGAGVLVVDSWSPADGDYGVDPNRSVSVNFHAHASLIEKEILYDSGADYGNNGTLTDVVETTNGIELATTAPTVDFEDYNVGSTIDGTQPDNWTWIGGTAAWKWIVTAAADAESWDGNHINTVTGNGYTTTRFDDGGQIAAGTIEVDCYMDSEYGAGSFCISTNLTGSGSAMRGHTVVFTTNAYAILRRWNSATSWSYIGTSASIGTQAEDTLYHIKVMFTTNGTSTWWYVKRWQDGNSEPGSYTYVGTDTSYVAAGYVGLTAVGGASAVRLRADNFGVTPDPATYEANGDWTSDELSMTDLVIYSHALVEWDETKPAGTAVSVKARWRNGGAWLDCVNGGQVPGIDVGEDTTAGSSKDSVEFKIELSTTDNEETPLVENFRFYHEPVANSSLSVDVGGQTAVESTGTLEVRGKRQISGGANVIEWDDLTAETFLAYKLPGLGVAVTAALNYNGVEIDDIVFNTSEDYWMVTGDRLGWVYSMNPVKYESAPVECRWNVHDRWSPLEHSYEWVLMDRTLGIHADAWYIVGHYQLDNHPGSFVLATPELSNHPGSWLCRGYARDNHPGSYLVQGYRHDNHPGSVLFGVQEYWNHPGSFVVAVEQVSSFPGSYLIYGVNSEGAIFVNVIDDYTYSKLVAEGVIFS